jgi:putative Mg2+ transporter-C (MgtC) family protein
MNIMEILTQLFGYQELEFLLEFLLVLGFALLCGLLIGGERELKHKPAGLRTQTLVVVASAMFTLMSQSVEGGEPTRIAAQIVTGVGFLGAGLILKSQDGRTVENVTTAASIWFAASVGMALGFGFYFVGLTAALIGTIIIRLPTHTPSRKVFNKNIKN